MSQPKPYKDCSCRDPQNPTRLLGTRCPDRNRKGHTRWYGRYEAPRAESGPRLRPRVGPFDTERECQDALTAIAEAKRTRRHVHTGRTRVGEILDRQMRLWESETAAGAPGALKPSTLESYREAGSLYLRPAFGHLLLTELAGPHHVDDLRAALRLINRPAAGADRSDLLRRLLEARAVRDGARISTRPLSEARITRIIAVLSSVLAPLVADGVLPRNPARRPGRRRGARRVKPLLWTAARAERWRETGEIPGKVMVWTQHQCGAFLDSITAERLYALFDLAAYTGLRRSELAGLCWADVDLDSLRIHVRQAQVDDELDSTKSADSDRILKISRQRAAVLRAWRKAQLAERLAWAGAWTDSGRVFTREDGTPLRPPWISARFAALARKAGLPPVRFHDLRHGAASMSLAAGVPMKVVSEILGHATVAFTSDVYTSVVDELMDAAAEELTAFIPRHTAPARAINGPSGGPDDH